jgi:acyl-homoserine lactone acylase PvdQ
MTTGGPDTSDVFEEEVADGKYRFKGEWRPLEIRRERIGVKSGDTVEWKDVAIESTHHGPIVAHEGGKAYSAAIPYANEFRLIEQSWAMMNARNLAAMKKALAGLQLMQQNVMVGTVDGDIYYVRNGRVPIRPSGCDPSRPMPGGGSCEWQGIHPFEDLIQVTNPPSGYLQNCNASPQWLWKDGSPFQPEKFKDRLDLFNAPSGPPHQRAAMVLELLDAAKNITDEKAIDIAFSPAVYGAGTWQDRVRGLPGPSDFTKLILNWDGRAGADSRAALAFYLFKMALGRPGGEVAPPSSLTDTQIVEALRKAEARLKSEFPADAVYGSLFRVGRDGGERTYPVGGGNPRGVGMATPRAITFVQRGKQLVGVAGQTATQVVVLTNPPRSYMVIPLGQSDRKDSPHWDDQARNLFSRSLVKPTYFLNPKELQKHVERTQNLEY